MEPFNDNYKKILFSKDDIEVLNYLTDNKIPFSSDDKDCLVAFDLHNAFNLALKFTKKGDGGFVLFRIEKFRDNLSQFSNLKDILDAVQKQTNAVGLWVEAQKVISTLAAVVPFVKFIKK